jgi:hypothetical protein
MPHGTSGLPAPANVVSPARNLPSATLSLVRTSRTPGKAKARTRGLLRCGVAAGPAFVTTFLIESGVRDGYRPLRHPVSSLALGPRGWIQTGNFTLAGTLFLDAAAGLARAGDPMASRRTVPALIGAAGAGLIGAAIFPTDPVSGYPPGTPGAPPAPSRTGSSMTSPADYGALDVADRVLDGAEAALALARARILHARFLADHQARPEELVLAERAAALYRQIADERGEGEALFWAGAFHQVVRQAGAAALPRCRAAALPVLERARELAAAAGDKLTLS